MQASRDAKTAASAIRPYLAQLLEAPTAQRIDRQLQTLLDLEVESQEAFGELLNQYEGTREWLRLYLHQALPAAEILPQMRKYHPLSASPNEIESPRYVCPVARCHQAWFRQDIDEAVPHCPIHDLPLVRESKVKDSLTSK